MNRSLETGNGLRLRRGGTPCPPSVAIKAMDQKQPFGGHGVPTLPDSHFCGVFAPLREPAFFKLAFIDHGAVTWPGGQVDLASDAMYDAIKANGTWDLV